MAKARVTPTPKVHPTSKPHKRANRPRRINGVSPPVLHVTCTHKAKYKEGEVLFNFKSLERFVDLVQRQHNILTTLTAGRKSLQCIELALRGSLRMFPPLQEAALASSLDEMAYECMAGVDVQFTADFHKNIEQLLSKVKSLMEEVSEFSVEYEEHVRSFDTNMPSAICL